MRWVKDEVRKQKDEENLRSEICDLKSEIRCPLCGKPFRADDAAACAACALAKRCGLVMCPNCGYEFAA
jgi:transcription elongation factor Elf1